MTQLPNPRGRLTQNRNLSEMTWLGVGGPADYLFQPADLNDLAYFLAELPRCLLVKAGFDFQIPVQHTDFLSSFHQSLLTEW